MVKAYLRYELAGSWGVISSPASNCVFDRSGRHLLTGALENVAVWNLKQAALVSRDCTPLRARATPACPPAAAAASRRRRSLGHVPPHAACAGEDAEPAHFTVWQGCRGGDAECGIAGRQPDCRGPCRRRGEQHFMRWLIACSGCSGNI